MATQLGDGSWEIQGRRLRFPIRITEAAAACATYLVRTQRARRLVAGTGLELVSAGGRTPLFLAMVDYKINDLGDYDEVGVAFLARHRGRTGPYVHQLPVTQSFTMEAGRALWGLPKWPARTELSIDGRVATCTSPTTPETTFSPPPCTPFPAGSPGPCPAPSPHSLRAVTRCWRAGYGCGPVVSESGSAAPSCWAHGTRWPPSCARSRYPGLRW